MFYSSDVLHLQNYIFAAISLNLNITFKQKYTDSKMNKDHFLNMCSMFIFSERFVHVEVNPLLHVGSDS